MNAVLLSLAVLFILSLSRVQLVVAMLAAAITAGWAAGLRLIDTIDFFTIGITDNAAIALSYALLGAYAAGLNETGLPERMVQVAVRLFGRQPSSQRTHVWSRIGLLLAIAAIACLSQNVIPIHIAFIPIFIPPLLALFNRLELDRRAAACALTFGLITPYMLIPVGFGSIFHETIVRNVAQNGLDIDAAMLPQAMWIPALGMVAGLLTAMLCSYRKRRRYPSTARMEAVDHQESSPRMIGAGLLSIAAMLSVQLSTGSMIYGAAAGIAVLLLGRLMPLQRAEHVLTSGMRQMAYIGFVMMSAAGLAAVLRATGGIESLVQACVSLVGDNRALAAMLMLALGLLVTLGIGSSFSTIPIIATVFVPLCLELGFSPLAIASLIGTAAALGDAGSPASDSTLGPTAGLAADGQHDHIWDTCVPTFLHYNVPLLIFGFIAAMVL